MTQKDIWRNKHKESDMKIIEKIEIWGLVLPKVNIL